jgi:hypothetical protein
MIIHPDLLTALQEFGEAHGHELEIAHEIGVLKERHQTLVGRCKNCHQLVVARFSMTPKPLLFSRGWKRIKVIGTEYYCKWAQMQNWGIDNP